jgi:hypothetical protein
MALGAAFRRLATFHEADVARLRERFAARVAGHDAVQHSPDEGLVTFRHGSDALWTARAVPMGRFVGDTGLLRWWWHGQLAASKSRLDPIVAEGQRYGIEELTRGSVQTESLETSEVVCFLAAHLAKADGLLGVQQGEDWSFFALYDAAGASISIAPPPIPSSLPPAAHASRTLAPPPALAAPAVPAVNAAPAEPSRELVSPLARETLSLVQASLPRGFRQAMLTVVIDAQGGKARLFIHVAVADDTGELHSLDPSQRLFDAVVTMVSEQRRRGETGMNKLVVRLRPTERGASIDVAVT